MDCTDRQDCGVFCPKGGHIPAEKLEALEPSVPPIIADPGGKRLKIAAAIAFSVWALYLALVAVHGAVSGAVLGIGGAVLAASVAMSLWVHRGSPSADRITAVGSLYLLLTSLALATVVSLQTAGSFSALAISFNAVWIAFFPALVPCSPKKTFIKSMIAASMTPLTYLVMGPLRGAAWAPAADLVAMVTPVYVAAGISYASARLMSRIGSQATQAMRLGVYELEEKLGEGGMGEVWRAKHHLLARPAAVKVMHDAQRGVASGSAAESQHRRFEREAQITASLQSPHTVELYDFGVTDAGDYYYVMELLNGLDLEKLVAKEGPMRPERAAHVLRQVLDSLAEAHAGGLVHRDIKPANIHIGRRGLRDDFVKVLDFGLVRPSSGWLGATKDKLSIDDKISGTPATIAPEALSDPSRIDHRVDIYAVGVVAFFLLTGRLPFEAATALSMAMAHLHEKPEPPSLHAPYDIPDELDAVVLACLEKNPEDRPQSAEELDDMIARLQRNEGWNMAGVGPSSRPTPTRSLMVVRDRLRSALNGEQSEIRPTAALLTQGVAYDDSDTVTDLGVADTVVSAGQPQLHVG